MASTKTIVVTDGVATSVDLMNEFGYEVLTTGDITNTTGTNADIDAAIGAVGGLYVEGAAPAIACVEAIYATTTDGSGQFDIDISAGVDVYTWDTIYEVRLLYVSGSFAITGAYLVSFKTVSTAAVQGTLFAGALLEALASANITIIVKGSLVP